MNVDNLCINTIRTLSIDMVEKAKSGHPGMPMGAATMAYVLWTKFLKHNPSNPKWPDRDRFVLSAGHGSALLYSLLHLTGYALSMDELKNFRQWERKTPGHIEFGDTPGVECTTGPLGQGFGTGVGMAMAERFLAARFNRPGHEIVNHYTYAIVSDGDLMEGISYESASLAGHFKLGNLIYLYDNNHITLAGETRLTFTDDVLKRFEALGWHVQAVQDGNDMDEISRAIVNAQKEVLRPSLISVRTHIGFGSPKKQDTFEVHGSPLGQEEAIATKKNLKWPYEENFYVPEEASKHFRKALSKGKTLEEEWTNRFESYKKKYPELVSEWDSMMSLKLADNWASDIPVFPADKKGIATRAAFGKVINSTANHMPFLIGGSADLNPSTNTELKGKGNFQYPDAGVKEVHGASAGPWGYDNSNIAYGVREHAMGCISNGLALHGGFLPFASTFLIFSDYMRPPMRLASLMKLHVIYIFTHDSVALGEDGPTHQPVEQLVGLRAVPGMTVIRPADANEVSEVWKIAVTHKKGPIVLIMTRQKLPVIDRDKYAPASGINKGAYVIADSAKPDIILIASGSEVHIALDAYEKLKSENIQARVINMASWELFESQSDGYKNEVLPPDIKKRISIEAGSTRGWHKYVGIDGVTIGVDHFGASAPGEIIMEKYGFTSENVIKKVKAILGR